MVDKRRSQLAKESWVKRKEKYGQSGMSKRAWWSFNYSIFSKKKKGDEK